MDPRMIRTQAHPSLTAPNRYNPHPSLQAGFAEWVASSNFTCHPEESTRRCAPIWNWERRRRPRYAPPSNKPAAGARPA